MIAMKTQFRLPTFHQRLAIMGRTGSGKTQFGSWILSRAPFDKQPYIIVDYKGDELLNSIDRAKEITTKEVPKQPGLYIVHPRIDEEEAMEAWLWKVWARGKAGLYIDEGYMLPKVGGRNGAFEAILTQGRSKRIPAIVLSQRPTYISRFVFSEADYYAVFHLNDARDRKITGEFMPPNLSIDTLPEYHSHWYDVGRNNLFLMQPVPSADEILDVFDTRLTPKRRKL